MSYKRMTRVERTLFEKALLEKIGVQTRGVTSFKYQSLIPYPGRTKCEVYGALRRMVEDGRLVKRGTNKYALPPTLEAPTRTTSRQELAESVRAFDDAINRFVEQTPIDPSDEMFKARLTTTFAEYTLAHPYRFVGDVASFVSWAKENA